MATVWFCTEPPCEIDYSAMDGQMRAFVLRGETLFDEKAGVAVPGWEEALASFVVDNGLNVPRDRFGLHAFVHWLIDEGHLPA